MINRAWRLFLHVTSAGNSNIDNDSSSSPNLPSSYDLDNIIAVAATDDDDLYASFTSFGATSVDLAAPGSQHPINGSHWKL